MNQLELDQQRLHQQLANIQQQSAIGHQMVIANAAKHNADTFKAYGPDGIREATRIFLTQGGDRSIIPQIAKHLYFNGQVPAAQALHEAYEGLTNPQGAHTGDMSYQEPAQTVEQMEQGGAVLRHYRDGGAVDRVMRQARNAVRNQ